MTALKKLSAREIQDREDGKFIEHRACLSCSSSDGMAVYEKSDGSKDAFCWVCNTYFHPDKLGGEKRKEDGADIISILENIEEEKTMTDTLENIAGFGTAGSRQRGIKKAFMEMYGVKVAFKESGAVSAHYYPLTKESKIVGYKKRELPKKFSVVGDGKDTELFGQSIFQEGEVQVAKKFLCITEGELDAIALQQVLWENGNSSYRNAVVSVPSGSSSAVKAIQNNWNWVNKFEQVVLFFDQDDPGQKAALDIAKKLPLGKVKIAKFSKKDPCEMLADGRASELYNAFWKAETYAPDGVLAGSGLWNLVSTPLQESEARYPWEGLDKLLHGIRTSEMVTLTAGSGAAKSTFARMIAYHLQKTTDDNIGMIFLEESVKKTALQVMSLEIGMPLHLPETQPDEEDLRKAYENTLGTGKYYFFDEFASQDFESICESIIYMARAANCKYIFLDHISMLVSGGDYADERRALDAICTKLRSLVQQLDITLFAITHLKRPPGKALEEGAQVSLNLLRGSAGIAQLSDIVIGFERNTQAEDPVERNTTHVRVLKNRFSGESGLACSLLYDHETGRAKELQEEEVEFMETDHSQFDGMPGLSASEHKEVDDFDAF